MALVMIILEFSILKNKPPYLSMCIASYLRSDIYSYIYLASSCNVDYFYFHVAIATEKDCKRERTTIIVLNYLLSFSNVAITTYLAQTCSLVRKSL